jgi:hypothetical protein
MPFRIAQVLLQNHMYDVFKNSGLLLMDSSLETRHWDSWNALQQKAFEHFAVQLQMCLMMHMRYVRLIVHLCLLYPKMFSYSQAFCQVGIEEGLRYSSTHPKLLWSGEEVKIPHTSVEELQSQLSRLLASTRINLWKVRYCTCILERLIIFRVGLFCMYSLVPVFLQILEALLALSMPWPNWIPWGRSWSLTDNAHSAVQELTYRMCLEQSMKYNQPFGGPMQLQ